MPTTRPRVVKVEIPKVISHKEKRDGCILYLLKWKNGVIEENDGSKTDSEHIEEYWNNRTEKTKKRIDGKARKAEIARERYRQKKLERQERERLDAIAQEEQGANETGEEEAMEEVEEKENCFSPVLLSDDHNVADVPSEQDVDDMAVVPGKQHEETKAPDEKKDKDSRPPIIIRIPRGQMKQENDTNSEKNDSENEKDIIAQENNTDKTITVTPEVPACVQLSAVPAPDTVSKPKHQMRVKQRTAMKSRGRKRKSDPGQYEVEKIVGHCIDDNGDLWYNIKWKGYNSNYNEWIQEDLMDCDDLVEEYCEEEGIQNVNRVKASPRYDSDVEEPIKKKARKRPKSKKGHSPNEENMAQEDNYSGNLDDAKNSLETGDTNLEQETVATKKNETSQHNAEKENIPFENDSESENKSVLLQTIDVDPDNYGNEESISEEPHSMTGSESPSQNNEHLLSVNPDESVEPQERQETEELNDDEYAESTSTLELQTTARESPSKELLLNMSSEKIDTSTQCSSGSDQKTKEELRSVSVQTEAEASKEVLRSTSVQTEAEELRSTSVQTEAEELRSTSVQTEAEELRSASVQTEADELRSTSVQTEAEELRSASVQTEAEELRSSSVQTEAEVSNEEAQSTSVQTEAELHEHHATNATLPPGNSNEYGQMPREDNHVITAAWYMENTQLQVALPTQQIEEHEVSPEYVNEMKRHLDILLGSAGPVEAVLDRMISDAEALQVRLFSKKREAEEIMRVMPFLRSTQDQEDQQY